MLKMILTLFICLSACASQKNTPPDPVIAPAPVDPSISVVKDLKWSYETYKENEKVINCSQATVQGTLSMGPSFPSKEKISSHSKKVNCEALAPIYNNTTKLYDREVECRSMSKPDKVLSKLIVSCGESKKTDSQLLQAKLKSEGLKLRFFCYF